MFRQIEKFFLEPFLFFFYNFFKSPESYFKYVMLLRHINRGFFRKPTTASSKNQFIKSKFFIVFKKNSKVLEIGCGELGLGYHLIRFLNNNCYVGVDISPSVIVKAKKLINSNKNIELKNPKIYVIIQPKDIKSIIKDNNIKIFIFSSVFTHLNKKQILAYLKIISKNKGAKIKVLADFSITREKHSYSINNIDYYYTLIDLKKIFSPLFYKVKFVRLPFKTDIYQSYLVEATN
jgi:hypothetical protein